MMAITTNSSTSVNALRIAESGRAQPCEALGFRAQGFRAQGFRAQEFWAQGFWAQQRTCGAHMGLISRNNASSRCLLVRAAAVPRKLRRVPPEPFPLGNLFRVDLHVLVGLLTSKLIGRAFSPRGILASGNGVKKRADH